MRKSDSKQPLDYAFDYNTMIKKNPKGKKKKN